jgi:7-cyano-7-deazaguanine synthase in queuosine biosynthesis
LDGIRTTWLGVFDAPERDLLRVMSAILAVDRLSPRQPVNGKRTTRELVWQRRLALRVSVECLERWTRATPILLRLLSFMTDDGWELELDAITEKYAQQQMLPLQNAEAVTEIALFSGGLDSTAGLLAQSERMGGSFLAVSACGNEVRSNAQRAAIDILRSHGASMNWLKFDHQLRGARLPRNRLEASQRSRGALFLAMGAAAASLLRLPTYGIYETGIGCLNLPLSTAQVGTQGTRAMHPRTLQLFNELVEAVLERAVRAVTPFFLHTKGELCRLAGNSLPNLARACMSCDEGEGHKADAMLHCGLCTSCLFRRVALHAAGLVPDTTRYRDVATKRHGPYELSTFEAHAARLRACSQFSDLLALDADVRFCSMIPFVAAPAPGAAQSAVRDMYQRYAVEVQAYFASARPSIKQSRPQARKEHERDLFSAAG